MSQQPEPPACIAKALAALYGLPVDPPTGELDGILADRYERVQAQTRAVWDALLAEGRIRYIARSHLYMDGPHSGDETVLVIPLPVVEARDATHLTPGGSA